MSSRCDEVVFDGVGFEWQSAERPLFEDLSFHLRRGWTGVVGANGSGKTTLLRLAAGALRATEGTIRRSEEVELCEGRALEPPHGFDELLMTGDGQARSLCGQLGIGDDWPWRWESLSQGERKRSQIATALWKAPRLLAVDEPTNHLDQQSRQWLLEALKTFRGVGLIVCHDRAFLDALCRGCLFLGSAGAVCRPGTYSDGAAQAGLEAQSARKEKDRLKGEARRLRRELRRRQQVADKAKGRLSKRGLARGDASGRAKIDGARLSGKDKRATQLAKRIKARSQSAQTKVDELKIDKNRRLGISLLAARSKRDVLFRMPEGSVDLGEHRRLRHPALVMVPDDRIALVGRNGSGKSTLLGKLVAELDLEPEQVLYMPQELESEASARIVGEVQKLPTERRGQVMIIVSRLGSRPERLLQSDDPSPGELRKLSLALGMARQPHLIIMDEPTNHLDLPSIECLEDALAECPCGLLLVSHDQRFLDRLCRHVWRIEGEPPELQMGSLETTPVGRLEPYV